MVLESIREEYLDLITCEFLFTHTVCTLEGNICSSCLSPKFHLTQLNSRHSNTKRQKSKFFFTSGKGWGFPLGEVTPHEFFIGLIVDHSRQYEDQDWLIRTRESSHSAGVLLGLKAPGGGRDWYSFDRGKYHPIPCYTKLVPRHRLWLLENLPSLESG